MDKSNSNPNPAPTFEERLAAMEAAKVAEQEKFEALQTELRTAKEKLAYMEGQNSVRTEATADLPKTRKEWELSLAIAEAQANENPDLKPLLNQAYTEYTKWQVDESRKLDSQKTKKDTFKSKMTSLGVKETDPLYKVSEVAYMGDVPLEDIEKHVIEPVRKGARSAADASGKAETANRLSAATEIESGGSGGHPETPASPSVSKQISESIRSANKGRRVPTFAGLFGTGS